MITYGWKQGLGFFHGDPQKCGEEIAEICGEVDSATPQDVLEKARDESTELHKCFEWDDTKAAEKYRIEQARQILRFIIVKPTQEEVEEQKQKYEFRGFYKTSNDEGYKPIQRIVVNKDEHALLLERAYAELHAFKVKYACLQELEEIFALID